MKLTVTHKGIGPADSKAGILYILVMKLEDRTLIKVGVTCRDRVEDRVCEILTSIWKRYRVFPECVVKRFTKVSAVYAKEKAIHTRLSADRYVTLHEFSGSTEFFTTSLEDVLKVYDEITN